MMDKIKEKVLMELMAHLDKSQGMDLKSLMDKKKAESMPMDVDVMEGEPKGIEIQKVSMSKDPDAMMDSVGEGEAGTGPEAMGDDTDEMSDDELKELLSKLM